ncbi:hypothetical protein KF913_12230 [Candidatus Obscuribacterales bacterium]|nr:hypothetical protein [Candidatus Obscuribacterales bacterium]
MPTSNSFATITGACSVKQITYPGTNNFSQLSYDGIGRNTKIVETVSGLVTSTRQFVWSGNYRA